MRPRVANVRPCRTEDGPFGSSDSAASRTYPSGRPLVGIKAREPAAAARLSAFELVPGVGAVVGIVDGCVGPDGHAVEGAVGQRAGTTREPSLSPLITGVMAPVAMPELTVTMGKRPTRPALVECLAARLDHPFEPGELGYLALTSKWGQFVIVSPGGFTNDFKARTLSSRPSGGAPVWRSLDVHLLAISFWVRLVWSDPSTPVTSAA